jgi:hypothetical protein
LERLSPGQQDEAEAISAEIQRVLLDSERVDADIIQIQYRLENSSEIESGGLGESDIESAAATRQQDKRVWLSNAMLLVQEHPDWSDSAIAEKLGRHPSQLSRSKEYQIAAASVRGDKSSIVDGFIVTDDDTGRLDVEAFSDISGKPDIDE